jgi:hypothetical protein
MKITIHFSVGILAIVCLAALGSTAVFAADAGSGPNKSIAAVDPATLGPTLEQAYGNLTKANPNYVGHRGAAMREIVAAAHLLGTEISAERKPEGKPGESQALSDLQVRSVQMTLLGVGRNLPVAANRDEIVNHINVAIEELTQALAAETAIKAGKKPAPAEPKPAGTVGVDAINSNRVEINSLERIYEILTLANHDYQGHRGKAMRSIAKACETLGGHASGVSKGGETQAASDEQLQQSEKLLEQVRDSFAASDPKAVTADLNDSVKELSAALAVK